MRGRKRGGEGRKKESRKQRKTSSNHAWMPTNDVSRKCEANLEADSLHFTSLHLISAYPAKVRKPT